MSYISNFLSLLIFSYRIESYRGGRLARQSPRVLTQHMAHPITYDDDW